MTLYLFKTSAGHRHSTRKVGPAVEVDGTSLRLRALDGHTFITDGGSGSLRVHAVAHGDVIHAQVNGRACIIERLDPTRVSAADSGGGSGDAQAPMPGVVVSWLVQPGSRVSAGDALLVIESMKLQATITAPSEGILEQLPFAVGQTFHRGAVLAHVRQEDSAGEAA